MAKKNEDHIINQIRQFKLIGKAKMESQKKLIVKNCGRGSKKLGLFKNNARYKSG